LVSAPKHHGVTSLASLYHILVGESQVPFDTGIPELQGGINYKDLSSYEFDIEVW